jgi:hypothetical protein
MVVLSLFKDENLNNQMNLSDLLPDNILEISNAVPVNINFNKKMWFSTPEYVFKKNQIIILFY